MLAQERQSLPELLTIKDFSRHFSISVAMIYKLFMRGDLIGRKVGNKTLIDIEEALRWKNNLPRSKHQSIHPIISKVEEV